MTRRRTSRGYAVLAATAIMAAAAAWLSAADTSLDADTYLEKSRERQAVAERLAEIGLQQCRRGHPMPWTPVAVGRNTLGRYRSQRVASAAGSICVGTGTVDPNGTWLTTSVELTSP